MLQLETNHQIILLYYREGLSIRKIASQLNIHRKTVKARIDQHERYKSATPSEREDPGTPVGQYLQKGPAYDSSGRVKRKLTDEIVAIIEAALNENEAKKLDGRHKQQMRRIDIHELILSAGHAISYSVLCDYIQKRLGARKEAFIRQEHAPGRSCEFDWGEVRLKIGDRYRRYQLAVFTSAFSNHRFALLYIRQDTLSFKEAHILFFEHVGGVFHEVVYDNMRVVIAKFVGRSEKHPTKALLELSRWYQFQWRFCNVARGNEKGHVERSVEYIRRKVFAFRDEFDSLQEAREYLAARVGELNGRSAVAGLQSPAALLEQERPHLYAHPGDMECFGGEHLRVDKYSTVCFGTNRYSVPDRLCGRMVFIKVYASELRVYDGNRVVCVHTRSYERHVWQIDLENYLATLHRKPGAVAGSVALKQAPDWLRDMYAEHFATHPKGFIELLQYCRVNDVPVKRLKGCVWQLARQYPSGITAEYVMAVLGNRPQDPERVEVTGVDAIEVRSMENLMEMSLMMGLD